MEVRSLLGCSLEQVQVAFAQAFADYDVPIGPKDLELMLVRRGYCPAVSFGAFDGDRLVSFNLNCTEERDGVTYVYDTGTGTALDYRGRGLSKRVFRESGPLLKAAGVHSYRLEVLQSNHKALSVYLDAGFQVSRELSFYVQEVAQLSLRAVELPDAYQLGPADHKEHGQAMIQCWDFEPSWQNTFASVSRSSRPITQFGLWHGPVLAGYCIFEPISGDITQLAVLAEHRRLGLGSALLREAARRCEGPRVKLINADAACASIAAFLQAANLPLLGKQFEMILSF